MFRRGHIGADALTPAGVEPLGDGRHYAVDVATAGNPIANYVLLGIGGVLTVVAVVAGSGLRSLFVS